MKQVLGLAVFALVVCSSPAAAQDVRAYTCTDSNNVVDHYWFGPGFFQMQEDRDDDTNECTQAGSVCGFDGSKYSATGKTWAFHFDSATGAYSLHFADDYDESGTCKPD